MSNYTWYRCFYKDEMQEESVLSAPARGVFSGLKKLMVSVGGPVKNDPAWIARRLSFRDKRTVVKGLEEILEFGLMVVTDAGLVHEGIMQEIKNHSAARAENGMKGGRGNKAAPVHGEEQFDNSFVSDGELMPNCSETGGSQPIEKQQNTEKLLREEKNIKKDSPLPPQAATKPAGNGHANGSAVGGQDPVQTVIQAFDRLLIEFFGKQAGRHFQVGSDARTAATLLDVAGGDVDRVIKAMEAGMDEHVDEGGTAPNALLFYGNRVSRIIANGPKPATLTTSSPPRAGKAKPGGEAPWVTIRSIAAQNWHTDISDELGRLGRTDPDVANALAESVRELVSRPKERAAA